MNASLRAITEERLNGRAARVTAAVLIAAAAVCIGLGVSGLGNPERDFHFMYGYLTAFMFYLTIALGALFFVMVHHLTGARWSIALRRLAEILMMNLPLMAVMMIPVLVWLPFMYPWLGKGDENAEILGKAAWLNPAFFSARAIFYLAVWIVLAMVLNRLSMLQDETGEARLGERMRRWSAPGMLLFAVTVTFAAFDWIMSLTPAWTSTIFGVYLFAGAVLAFLGAIILLALGLALFGRLRAAISVEHYHDLGKLLFAFVIFWAYIAFSQLLLIWMGNMPEETAWYQRRWQPADWRAMSIFLIVGHFIGPFLLLLPRAIKRTRPLLALAALWLLVMHYVDLYWLIMPVEETAKARPAASDLLLMVGFGALFAAFTLWRLQGQPLLPIRDPHLVQSLEFENS